MINYLFCWLGLHRDWKYRTIMVHKGQEVLFKVCSECGKLKIIKNYDGNLSDKFIKEFPKLYSDPFKCADSTLEYLKIKENIIKQSLRS